MRERTILIDWKKFAERVPVNTLIQYENKDSSISHGMLIENFPYAQKERMDSYSRPMFVDPPDDLECDLFWLRYQEFSTLTESTVLPYISRVQYFINGEWLTFDEVMA